MKLLWILSMIIGIICLDQVTKALAMGAGEVSLNMGIALGLADQGGWIFNFGGLVIIGGLLWWQRDTWSQLTLAAIWAGGLSNVVDRWWWGGVRDWLPVPFTSLQNNLADYAVTFGLLAWVYLVLRPHHDHT